MNKKWKAEVLMTKESEREGDKAMQNKSEGEKRYRRTDCSNKK